MDIGGWLRGLGLERYEQAFRETEIAAIDSPGASRPFRRIPATVLFLITQQPLGVDYRNWSSCPKAAPGDQCGERPRWVMGWTPPDGICVPR